MFFGHTDNMVFAFVSHWLLQISAAVASVLLFFLVYWILPNRKLPVRAVLPTAIVIGLSWEVAKMLYVAALPWMDLQKVYGPFSVSVSLMLWAFVTGLLLLAGAHYSASRHALRIAYLADLERAKEEKAAEKSPLGEGPVFLAAASLSRHPCSKPIGLQARQESARSRNQ